MSTPTLHSKLIDLQGEMISVKEGSEALSQIRGILLLESTGRISSTDAASRIRQIAWRIAEDLRIDDLDLSSGSDESLLQNLPALLKI